MKAEEIFIFEAFDKTEYYRTFEGRIKKMWETANRRTGIKGHKGTIITQKEFFELAKDDPEYKRIYQEWVKSGFELKLTPTLDRKDAKKGYVEGNLQFLTYTDNVVKGNKEYDKKPYEARRIKIEASNGDKVKTFNSLMDVSRFFDVNPSTITRSIQKGGKFGEWVLKPL